MPGPAGEHDRVVGRAVAEAAGADEVDALELAEGHGAALAVALAGEGCGDDEDAGERRDEGEDENPETHAA